jgi:hypothetical protein
MLRTAQSLPLEGLSTLGVDPARFQTEPPACYRASWQLPGPDSHRLATTSFSWIRSSQSTTSNTGHTPVKWCMSLSASSSSDVYAAAGIAITSSGSLGGSASAFAIDSALM